MSRIQNIIDTLPDQAKRNALFSLVGSLNATVVGTASSVAARLTREDMDFREVEPRDVELLLTEADDRKDALLVVRRATRVAQNLRDQLLAVSNDSESGSLKGTMDFMSRPNTRALDTEMLSAVLSAAELDGIDVKHFEALNKLNAVQRAERFAAQRGAVEWIVEHVFTSTGYEEQTANGVVWHDESTNEEIEALPQEAQERLHTKLLASLNRSRDETVLGVLNKDTRYTFGDLPLIAAAIKEAKSIEHHTQD